jgi:hypothetical protein
MLGDVVIVLANMRGGYVDVGGTVHTLFRMTGRPRKTPETSERPRAESQNPTAPAPTA